ncbi:hypothetical protein Lal_00002435 [Lupinus albus]|nr:hypothetical protein Lal_00004869 [Lupinus albus]KAF1893892.1 hypothetical protein Lal_00002435 [Lupinus albus]
MDGTMMGAPNAIEKLMQLGFHLIVLVVESDEKLSEPNNGFTLIEIPEQCLITNYDNPIHAIVKSTYPNSVDEYMNEEFLQCRAILASTIETFDEINDYVLSLIPCRHSIIFFNIFINVMKGNIQAHHNLTALKLYKDLLLSLPNHKIKLKIGTPIMLLRNLDQTEGLCNGTKMIVNRLANHVIEAKVMTEKNVGKIFYIPRMSLSPSHSTWHFKLTRRQFPLTVSYVMTINKVQSMEGLKILIHDKEGKTMNTTINVVFKEVFQNL